MMTAVEESLSIGSSGGDAFDRGCWRALVVVRGDLAQLRLLSRKLTVSSSEAQMEVFKYSRERQ